MNPQPNRTKRAGPGNPGYKATRLQMEERVEAVSDMIAQRWRGSQIKAAIRKKYGPLSARQIAAYISRARANALREANTSRQELIAKSLWFNEAVIRDPKTTIAEKQRSDQAIRELFGLDAPKRQEVTGRDREPLPVASQPPTLIILPDNGRMAPVDSETKGKGE